MAEQARKVGDRIAEERNDRGWSRPEMARRMPGVSTGNDVYRWENGKHLPRSDTLEAIADLFGLEVADLYAGPVADREQKAAGGSPLDELSAPQSSTDLDAKVERLENEFAELRGEFSEMRTDLSLVLSLLQRDERGQGAPGGK